MAEVCLLLHVYGYMSGPSSSIFLRHVKLWREVQLLTAAHNTILQSFYWSNDSTLNPHLYTLAVPKKEMLVTGSWEINVSESMNGRFSINPHHCWGNAGAVGRRGFPWIGERTE